ncbi:MAG: porphobilinogen synthase [Pelagibacteraceae bacterium]|nr:porphobilinogen synthase [Pelagibacteraceae bacterium]|tara:strand:+ start:12790 stop:13782 length:993 start_codon:yes stop_codon:yes gene_type:complete
MKIVGKYPDIRLRRIRNSSWMRRLIAENDLSVNDLILPIFIREGKNKVEKIKTMPGVFRYTVDKLNVIMKEVKKYKIPMVALFPYTPNSKKDNLGSEALNENNLVCKSIRYIKKKYSKIGIMCDVALDPYTDHGHDGIIINKKIDNDETIKILIKQSILQAKMGCDVIAPSDMMDGRIKAIRKALDKENLKDVNILSYSAKYASNFYGPFRDAVGSNKKLKFDKKTYQMDFRNSNEAYREIGLDIKEGADIVMVKPGLPYLDIIKNIKDKFKIPVFAYQVSGEYSLIKFGILNKLINEDTIFESLISFKRAGASAIVTYFALDIAKKISS